ncbi:MAG: hypothetical protein RLZZ387_2342 [Chloroflexota bacterium]|jgi:hypothetical protein
MGSRSDKKLTVTDVTRVSLVQHIGERLAGHISEMALAKWAFDCFYAAELGEVTLEEGAEEQIEETLDALMFSDEPDFRLSEEALRALIAQLGNAK